MNNRIIKFRAWDNGMFEDVIVSEDTWCDNLLYDSWHIGNIMQYTGLTDKNGKEIYEGDIINLHVFTEELGEGYGVVEGEKEYTGQICINEFGVALKLGEGEDDWFYLVYAPGMIHEESFEVIGNIFENPLT